MCQLEKHDGNCLINVACLAGNEVGWGVCSSEQEAHKESGAGKQHQILVKEVLPSANQLNYWRAT